MEQIDKTKSKERASNYWALITPLQTGIPWAWPQSQEAVTEVSETQGPSAVTNVANSQNQPATVSRETGLLPHLPQRRQRALRGKKYGKLGKVTT